MITEVFWELNENSVSKLYNPKKQTMQVSHNKNMIIIIILFSATAATQVGKFLNLLKGRYDT